MSLMEILDETRVYGKSYYTHVSMGEVKGCFCIGRNKHEKLYDSLNKESHSLAEVPQLIMPLLVDIDLKIPYDADKDSMIIRLYTDYQLESVVRDYQEVIKSVVKDYRNEHSMCFVLEKPAYSVEKNGITYIKNGFHLHFPYLFLHKDDIITHIFPRVRNLLNKSKAFKNLGFENAGDDLLDTDCIRNPWLMYGGCKNNASGVYKLTTIYDYEREELSLECALRNYKIYDSNELEIDISGKEEKYLNRVLSIIPWFRETSELKQNLQPIIKHVSIKESYKGEEININIDYDLDDNGCVIKQRSDKEKENMKILLELCNKQRFKEFIPWITLCYLIKGNGLSVDLFLKISEESGYQSFNKDDCLAKWYNIKPTEKCVGFKTIHRWLDEDGVDWKSIICPKRESMINDLLNAYYKAGTLTDLAVSEIFFKNYKDSLYYTQQGWIHYNEYRGWEIGTDDDIIYPLMKLIGEKFIDYANKMKASEKEDEKEFSKKVKALKKEGIRLCSTSVCQKIIKTSKTLFTNNEIINEFDNKPYWFCFNDMKAIDLKTKEVINVKKEDKIIKHCGYPLPVRNEDKIKDAMSFIKSIQGEDNYESFMSCISTNLCGNPLLNQIFFIHTGSGANGKSLLFLALRYILGNYHGMLPIDNLTKNSNGKDSADSSLVSLNGSRCAQSNEPEDEKETVLKVARIKEYSGEEFIKCRDLHKSAFQMRITFHLNILCNEKPKLSKSDEAIERRIRCIPYPYKFLANPNPNNPNQKKRDDNLGDYIKNNKEFRDGLLYLLIDHWNINQGKYKENENQREETSQYIKSNNPLLEFFQDYEQSDKPMNIKDLRKSFNNCYENKLSAQQFFNFTKQLGFEIKEDNTSKSEHKIYIKLKDII